MEPILEGVTYSITVRELEEGKDIESGKILFERSDIRENVFRYPAGVPPLDTSKAYSWEISAYDKNKVLIGKAIPAVFVLPPPSPLSFCLLFEWNSSPKKVCLGSPMQIGYWLVGGSGPLSWSLSNGQTGTTSPITISPLPTNPGTYTYTLIVTRGSCTRTKNITFYVYPNLTASINKTQICKGDDAQLNIPNLPTGYTVVWDWNDNSFSGPWTGPGSGSLGQGTPKNTNPITPTCVCPSVTRWFRATVTGGNLPTPWPGACQQPVVSLTVWCPTVAGTITPTSSTHTIQLGNKICSGNNYPVSINLSLTGNCGNIISWTRSPGSIPASTSQTISDQIMAPGTYTYTVTVRNGPAIDGCAPKTAQITIIVEDPPSATLTSNKTEVCWGKDAILTLSGITPPGATIQWQYQVNCNGPWIWATSGVISTVQNTNELFGTSYPGVFPPTATPCDPNKICWRAIVTSPTGICGPTTVGPLTIDVFVPPTAPTITPGPIVKCFGQPVMLTSSTPACGTLPLTYQWYLNGLPVATGQTIPATDPGNYFVVVTNKNNCTSAQSSNTVTVMDCITKVVIQGPCTCSAGTSITLTANASSMLDPPGPPSSPTCGGPYTYLWSTGATTQSITMPCPSQTTTLWVEVTNAMGCKTKVFHTIKKCI